jgi:hypothetical protein
MQVGSRLLADNLFSAAKLAQFYKKNGKERAKNHLILCYSKKYE